MKPSPICCASQALERLAADLRNGFPDMKGFSRSNLFHMRSFAKAWPQDAIVQQADGQLPWSHNLMLLSNPIFEGPVLEDRAGWYCWSG